MLFYICGSVAPNTSNETAEWGCMEEDVAAARLCPLSSLNSHLCSLYKPDDGGRVVIMNRTETDIAVQLINSNDDTPVHFRHTFVRTCTGCCVLFVSYTKQLLLLLLHLFNGLFSKTWVNRYQKGKTSLDLNEARDDGVWGNSGISWTIWK